MAVQDPEAFKDILMAIMEADLETLQTLQSTINVRREYLSEMRRFENEAVIAVGDVVTICNLSTDYLNGCAFKIDDFVKKGKCVKGSVVSTYGSNRKSLADQRVWGKIYTLPLQCVKPEDQ